MKGWRTALAVSAVASIAAPLTNSGSVKPSDTYAYATYWEKRDDVTVLLDSLTMSFRDDQPFVPVPVAIGYQAYGKEYTFSRESFYLIDDSGKLYGAAAYEEVADLYSPLTYDRTFSRGRPVTAQEFVVSRRVQSDFYPPQDRGNRIDQVHLSAYSWFRDVIYFPRPEVGLKGVLTLRVSGGGIDPPIDVRFKVPLKGIPIR